MIEPRHLRDLVVRPVLERLNLHSLAAEQLVMGTAAQESRLRWLRQNVSPKRYGPGRGIFQLEPATARDLMYRYLERRPRTAEEVRLLVLPGVDLAEQLEGNLYLGAALCRVRYLMDPRPLPAAGDLPGLALTWKRVYNTAEGAGTPEAFCLSWRECGLDRLYREVTAV